MPKRVKVCSYTSEGRELIHTSLSLNKTVMYELKDDRSKNHSIELLDSRISLFSAQKGKCAICGEEFVSARDVVCWLKKPKDQGGTERYKNMALIHRKYLPLLQNTFNDDLKALAKALKVTAKMASKINSLREQAGLTKMDNVIFGD